MNEWVCYTFVLVAGVLLSPFHEAIGYVVVHALTLLALCEMINPLLSIFVFVRTEKWNLHLLMAGFERCACLASIISFIMAIGGILRNVQISYFPILISNFMHLILYYMILCISNMNVLLALLVFLLEAALGLAANGFSFVHLYVNATLWSDSALWCINIILYTIPAFILVFVFLNERGIHGDAF